MNDFHLAQSAYQLIHGHKPEFKMIGHHKLYAYSWGLTHIEYVRDWRVLGTLMEMCLAADVCPDEPADVTDSLCRSMLLPLVNVLIEVKEPKNGEYRETTETV